MIFRTFIIVVIIFTHIKLVLLYIIFGISQLIGLFIKSRVLLIVSEKKVSFSCITPSH